MTASPSAEVLRIANCSGFYGDRLAAAREMVDGGPIDVLTGDYLAELTLMILHRDRQAEPSLGYAKTFPVQLRQIAADCFDRGIKIVVNAGGLNPAACAEACRAVYHQLGLQARVAHLEGDDLLPRLAELQGQGEAFRHLDRGTPLSALDRPMVSANAYLGGWGIARALELGADLVICPRVTDASLVLGPAAWRFGWRRDDWHRLASAVVAGHILECGPQATGGNYSFFRRVQGLEHPGFPIAEINADGSFVVTKHPGTGGEVSIGTVTAQLLYEIDSPRYLNPDVTARFDTLELTTDGPDRVRVRGACGEPPPATTKVCCSYLGGYKNSVTFLLTGLEIEAKAQLVEQTMWAKLGGRDDFAETDVRLVRAAATDNSTISGSFSSLTVAVKDPDPQKVGRRFSNAAVEMALASYPGLNLTAPPGKGAPYGVLWPTLVSRDAIDQRLVFEGREISVPHSPLTDSRIEAPPEPDRHPTTPEGSPLSADSTELVPLGRICGARSGDKGGNANLGLWTESGPAYEWLQSWLTNNRLRELIPETRELVIDRYLLPNLRALNFVIRGFLGDGVAASLAIDPQAKGLGEVLRARRAPVPTSLLKPF